MLYPSVNFESNWSSLQKLSIRNQKCDNADDDAADYDDDNGDMIPISRTCFAEATQKVNMIFIELYKTHVTHMLYK